jgi:hypothetical protein
MKKIDRKAVGSDGKADSTHYGGADNPHETIKCLHAWGLESDALLWTSGKYISRAGKKSGTTLLRDLEKAHYYLGRRIEQLRNSIEKPRRGTAEQRLEKQLKAISVIPGRARLRVSGRVHA